MRRRAVSKEDEAVEGTEREAEGTTGEDEINLIIGNVLYSNILKGREKCWGWERIVNIAQTAQSDPSNQRS